jgi:hypothetical protein
MTNSTVQALVVANMLTAISFDGHGHYEIALGIGEDHEHEEEHDEHKAHANIRENCRMCAEETGEHIHEEHLAENAPISSVYVSDMRYTLTLTCEATSMPHDSMSESMSNDSMTASSPTSTGSLWGILAIYFVV